MRKWIITVTVILCSMLELIDTSIVNVALSDMMGNLGATLNDVSWVVASYSIANVIVVPMTGFLSSHFGRKNYYAGSVVLFTIASFLCGNATNIWELVAFRFIQGLGGGALLATSQIFLVETFPPEELGLANGLFGLGVVIGSTIGPTLGGVIVDNLSWPWIFYVNLPIGILATLLSLAFIDDSLHAHKSKGQSVDWLGVFLLVVGIGLLQLVLEQGERDDWFEATYITVCSIVAGVGLILFIVRELNTEHPVVDLHVLRHGNLAMGAFLSFILGFGLYSSVFVFPIFAQQTLGFTATQTGLILLPGAMATGFMMPIVGKLIQRGVSQRIMIPIGFLLFALFTFMMYALISPTTAEDAFFYPLIVRGFGMGLIFVPLTTIALAGLKGPEIPQGAGMTNMMRQLGGSFGVAIVSTYVGHRSQVYRADMLRNLGATDPMVLQRLASMVNGFVARGSTPFQAQQQAYAALDRTLTLQSFLRTYMDVFLWLGVFFICCLPLVFFLKRGKPAGPVEMH